MGNLDMPLHQTACLWTARKKKKTENAQTLWTDSEPQAHQHTPNPVFTWFAQDDVLF